jgi:ubiquitin carboxyl-terminal hydrolase 36/42
MGWACCFIVHWCRLILEQLFQFNYLNPDTKFSHSPLKGSLVSFTDDEETLLMPELKFKPKPKKAKAASASKATQGSCVDQNAMHLMRGMPASRRKALQGCMPTPHNAKQESRRCPASDPVDKKKRKVDVQY